MPKWSAVSDAKDLREMIESNTNCCLKGYVEETMLPERVIATWAQHDEETDDDRVVVYQTALGTIGVYEEGEDYTGHG